MTYLLPRRVSSKQTQNVFAVRGPWFHKGLHAYPLTLGMVGDAVMVQGIKKLPWSLTFGICFYRNAQSDWFWNKPEQFRMRKRSLQAQLKDASFIVRITRARAKAQKEFEHQVSLFRRLDLRSLSAEALWCVFDHVLYPYALMWGWGVISEPFLGDGEEWLSDALQPELQRMFGAGWREKLRLLAVSPHVSFVYEEHLSLLAIAAALKRKAAGSKKPSYSRISLLKALARDAYIQKLLQRHVERFWWIEDNYTVFHNYHERHFLKKALRYLGQEPAKERMRLRRQHQQQLNRKRKLLRRLSTEAKRLVQLSDELMASSDGRKLCVFKISCVWFGVVGELARRFKVSFDDLMCAMPEEIYAWLHGKSIPRDELKKRRRGSLLYVYTTKGYSLLLVKGRAYNKLLNGFLGGGCGYGIAEIRGTTACPGSVRGVVRVVLTPKEIAQVKRGEILVTNNTTPDFVPAMRKAAAIVTEQGGITSHAALVSRELGVPCVIGTRVASRVFKTGDRVEVDATNGIVRKL